MQAQNLRTHITACRGDHCQAELDRINSANHGPREGGADGKSVEFAALADGVLVDDAVKQLRRAKDIAAQLESEPLAADARLREELSALETTESLIFPISWYHPESGHAMVLEFEKEPDDQLIMRIYNLGAGARYHIQSSNRLNGTVRSPAPFKKEQKTHTHKVLHPLPSPCHRHYVHAHARTLLFILLFLFPFSISLLRVYHNFSSMSARYVRLRAFTCLLVLTPKLTRVAIFTSALLPADGCAVS